MAYPANFVITVTTPGNINPKVKYGAGGKALKSYPRFDFYLQNPGCTVGQYYAWCAAPAQSHITTKGIAALDLAWDTRHGYITVAAPVAADTPAPAAPTLAASDPPQVAALPVQPKQRKQA